MNGTMELAVFELPAELKNEFQLLSFGEHETVDGDVKFPFDPADAGAVVSAFKARGIDLLLDWEHQSIAHLSGFEMFKAPDGRAPAAGWSAMEARSDGLWATGVRWTPDAVTALKAGEYRYYSPVLLRNAQGRVVGIQSVGLTNEPRLKNVPALAARRDLGKWATFPHKECMMKLTDELAGALGVKPDASEPDILIAVKALKDKATAGEAAAGQVTAFKTASDAHSAKVIVLEGQLATATAGVATLNTEITALKSQAKAQSDLLADSILSFAKETGRIKPADELAWKPMIERDPASALVALKSIATGTAVPIGKLTETPDPAAAEQSGPGKADDHLTACKNVFEPAKLKVHEAAIAYQKKNPNTNYVDALTAVTPKK